MSSISQRNATSEGSNPGGWGNDMTDLIASPCKRSLHIHNINARSMFRSRGWPTCCQEKHGPFSILATRLRRNVSSLQNIFLIRPLLSHTMSYFASPEFCRVILLGGIVALHVKWRELINLAVPEPYLDEVFHVPQAQAYWEGRWSEYDPKITTPAGLYYFSHVVNKARQWINPEFDQTTEELRFVNSILLYLLLIALYIWTAVSKREVNYGSVLQREFAIILFPLLFFFSGLYYTDLFSAFAVVVTYTCWSAGSQSHGAIQVIYQLLHLAFGILSLLTRQTNIFWVAIFLGGLQIAKTVKKFYPKDIHDSPISEAFFEGQYTTM